MIHHTRPANFNPSIEVVGCVLVWNNQILLLQRSVGESFAGSWGLPAGKVESGENLAQAVVREIREETSISLKDTDIKHSLTVDVTQGGRDLVFHMFESALSKEPAIRLNAREHTQYSWMTIEQAIALENGIEDLDHCLKIHYKK